MTKRLEIIDVQGSVSVYEAEDKLLRSRSGGVATPGDIPVAASTVSSETSYGITPSAGAAATFSRGDHTHGSPAAPVIPAAADSVASETSYGITPAVGVATTYARGDHTHGSPAAPTIPSAADTVVTETGYAQSSTAGTAATFSRSDHTHGTPVIVSDTYHGIAACGALSLSGSTVTLAGTVTYWYQGSKYTTASNMTCDLNSDTVKDIGSGTKLQTNQSYYVYFKDATGTLYWSTVAWSLTTKVPVCSVYWNGSAGAICRETHNHTRDLDWHTNAHLTIGARYYSGLDLVKPTTSVDSSLELTEGVVYDEDIANTITNALSKISRIWYLTSGKYTWVDSTLPYAGTTGDPKYANGTTLVSVTDSRFVAMWVYASPDVDRPIYIFPGTTEETTIAAARALTPPVLAGYGLTPELKLIYRFIFRGDGEFQESADYRTASSLPSGFISATTASSVSVVPHGDIASTNVQSALEELDTEKAAVGQTMYIGTTANAINRASAAQSLTGITSIDGSAATLTTARTINGISFNGSADILVPSLYDGNYRRITNPGGGEYIGTGGVSGAIAITFPVGFTDTMVRLTVKIYDYYTNESFEVHCGGYTSTYSGGTWQYNPFAYILGNPSLNRNFTVRFGVTSANKCIIYIGELNSSWDFPQVFVTEVQCGFGGQSATWTTGWSIGFESSSFQGVTASLLRPQIGYATTTNTAYANVVRDGSGNFSAGTITANLTGNASGSSGSCTGNAATATTLATARSINGVSFDGSANIMVPSLYDGNYRRITNPGGGEYCTTTLNVTGAIAITLPVDMTRTLLQITVKIYDYRTNGSFEVHCGGYTFAPGGNTWEYSPFAYIIGNPGVDRRLTVRFGYTSTNKCIIYIGELSSTWLYPQVYVTEVQCGLLGLSVTFTTGWSIGFESTAFQNVTATITNPQVGYATTTNTANACVLRDSSGNFASGTITAPTLVGSTTASGTLTLKSTSNATKGNIIFGTSKYDEVNNRLGIGKTPTSAFDVNGAISTAVANKTSTYTASITDSVLLCDATSAGFSVNLPTASGITGRQYTIKKIDSSANAITVDPYSTETVDGAATLVISTQWNSVTVVSDGTNWMII